MSVRVESRPPMERSRPSRRILNSEITIVRNREEFARPFGEKILAGTATKDDVLTWYKSQDPVGEDLMRIALTPSFDNIREAHKFYLANSRIYEEGAKIYLKESGLTAAGFNLDFNVADKLRNGKLSADELEDMLFGIDMLSASGRDADLARDAIKVPGLVIKAEAIQEAEARIISTNTIMNSLLEQIYIGIKDNPAIEVKSYEGKDALLSDQKKGERGEKRRILEYGVKAFMMHMCNVGFNESSPESAHEYRKAFISAGIEYLREFFLEKGLLSEWIRQNNKGGLLETLWVFDAYLYLTMQGRDFAQVVPALDNQDRPFADPKMDKERFQYKRAIDVLVYDRFKGISYFVQLGQEGKGNGSHASILTIRENHFRDLDPVRLRDKLSAYEMAVNADFAPLAANRAMVFLLKTVPKAYSKRFAITDFNMFQEALGIKPDITRNKYLVDLSPLDIPTERLPLVVQEQLVKKSEEHNPLDLLMEL